MHKNGEVTNWRSTRGSGWILSDDGRDYRFAESKIIKGDIDSIRVGTRVLFTPDVRNSGRDPQAWHVVVLEDEI